MKMTKLASAIVGLALLSGNVLADDLPNVSILATGGTIAGSASSATNAEYTAGKVMIDTLVNAVPQLKDIADVKGEQIASTASGNLTEQDWFKLANRINELLAQDDTDGIVITHGTDTIEETAYFLNLVVKSDKPVVLVGAMRPSTAISADGPLNLYNAVSLAGSESAKGKGVMVVLNDTIHGARGVTKTNTASVNTFESKNGGPLGYMSYGKPSWVRQSPYKHTYQTEFDISDIKALPTVDIMYLYIETPAEAVDYYVKERKVDGMVFAGSGNGSLTTPLQATMEQYSKQLPFIRASRTGSGNTPDVSYYPEFPGSQGLSAQQARILLKLALTETQDPKEVAEFFHKY
ncbi:type II asparaginase [Parendozoicomonas haliclonae]|uniref:L-asparaginase n=1 Tax=Parendozoicomonas haliclonae TaxID=1960125 RepID=A0A1X7APW5_9GAMM|nr:type II asparaginase [Parendozoicomonas haliclonae]SMA50183.1 L-asparaginase precursor [Parendozoicomonas haliclonae]